MRTGLFAPISNRWLHVALAPWAMVILGLLAADARAEDTAKRPPRPQIDDQRLASHGIRKVESRHLALYTDLPITETVAELPRVFDAAVPQWCAYFDVPVTEFEDWQMVAYLMKDKQRFHDAGVLPARLPPFQNGYQRNWEIWLYDQPSDYYRRHLLLHEGTHAFMTWHFAGAGPPWYREGMAELLGTHRWEKGKLTLAYFPRSRDEVSHWGRIRIIKDEVQAGRALTLVGVFKFPPDAHLRNEPYAWCWAATWFLEHYPTSRNAFRQLKDQVRDDSEEFSRRFYERLKPHWDELNEQWQLFIMNIDYGYDLSKAIVLRKPAVDLPAEGTIVSVLATRGWQSSGIRLQAGLTYRIRAVGRYQVATDPQIWWCEPGGVTIRYHEGRPLGMLLGAVCDDDRSNRSLTPLAHPQPIGLVRTWRCERTGTLYLRINESAAALGDNAGSFRVQIRSVP